MGVHVDVDIVFQRAPCCRGLNDCSSFSIRYFEYISRSHLTGSGLNTLFNVIAPDPSYNPIRSINIRLFLSPPNQAQLVEEDALSHLGYIRGGVSVLA